MIKLYSAGPTCFVAIVFMLGIAIYLARSLKSNEFFLYFAEGRNQFFAIDPDHEGDMDRISYLSLFCKSFPYLLSGYLNYAVALSVFPGVTSLGRNLLIKKNAGCCFQPVLKSRDLLIKVLCFQLNPPWIPDHFGQLSSSSQLLFYSTI